MTQSPELIALTEAKSEFEKKLVRLSEISNITSGLKQAGAAEEIRLTMAGSDEGVLLSAYPSDEGIALKRKLDTALAACRNALAEARNLRRLKIVSSKANQAADLKKGLKKLAEAERIINGQIADIDKEIKAVHTRQSAAGGSEKENNNLFSPALELRER
jgi:hypothetical protein